MIFSLISSCRGPAFASEGRGGHCYAFPGRPKAEAINSVITGIAPVCHCPKSMSFDHGSTYSYVSIYFSLCFDLSCDTMSMRVHISTSIGQPLVVD